MGLRDSQEQCEVVWPDNQHMLVASRLTGACLTNDAGAERLHLCAMVSQSVNECGACCVLGVEC